MLDEAEKQQDKGLVSEGSVSRLKAAMEESKGRELSLSERATELSAERDAERAILREPHGLERRDISTRKFR